MAGVKQKASEVLEDDVRAACIKVVKLYNSGSN